jgi:transposase-like protein
MANMITMPRKSSGQHFLLCSKARTLSLTQVFGLSNQAAEDLFRAIRWTETEGKPVCPHCGCTTCYDCRRPSGASRWRCMACRKDFSVTSGTLFAFHKMPLRIYLAAIVIFVNEVKGKAALAMSRDLGVQYKTAFVLAHKLREAMAAEMRDASLGGPGTIAEVDGCYVGGHVRQENMKKDRKDRRLAENQNGKRKCVVVIRERNGRTVTKTFASEEASVAYIRRRLDKGGEVHADESPAWNPLHARYDMKRVNHQDGYSIDGACTNGAESFFSRLRRAEIGIYHHIGGAYVDRYAQEAAFREDHRRQPNGTMFGRVTKLVAGNKPSVDFCGYWQRNRAAA